MIDLLSTSSSNTSGFTPGPGGEIETSSIYIMDSNGRLATETLGCMHKGIDSRTGEYYNGKISDDSGRKAEAEILKLIAHVSTCHLLFRTCH